MLGEWKNDKCHGNGVYLYQSGGRYEGERREGRRHGKGKWWSPTGDFYEGEWKLNKRYGYGVYLSQCGGKYEGDWKRGKRHGKGKQWFSDDDIYEGLRIEMKLLNIGRWIQRW